MRGLLVASTLLVGINVTQAVSNANKNGPGYATKSDPPMCSVIRLR